MTACRLYSLHRVFLRFCLSEYGTYRTAHSYAGISTHRAHTPDALLSSIVLLKEVSSFSFIQYKDRSSALFATTFPPKNIKITSSNINLSSPFYIFSKGHHYSPQSTCFSRLKNIPHRFRKDKKSRTIHAPIS